MGGLITNEMGWITFASWKDVLKYILASSKKRF